MISEGASAGGRPRKRGYADDPLVTVNLHLRQSQLSALDHLADARNNSRAELVREAIDLMLSQL